MVGTMSRDFIPDFVRQNAYLAVTRLQSTAGLSKCNLKKRLAVHKIATSISIGCLNSDSLESSRFFLAKHLRKVLVFMADHA